MKVAWAGARSRRKEGAFNFFPAVSVLCVWLVVVGRRLGWLWTVSACLALWGSWLLQFSFDLFWCKLFVCVVGCCGCLVRMGAAKSERARRGAWCGAGAGEDVLW